MFESISVNDLKKMNNINLIDVRDVEKYNNGYIMNAVNIPAQQLLSRTERYLDRGKKYYIYCQKGIQSRKVCQILSTNGYSVVNVSGGYESWIINQ